MIRMMIPLAFLAFAGCTNAGLARGMGVLPPGYGVTPEAAGEFCGSYDAFLDRVEVYRAEVRESNWPRPHVGDSACEVYAKIGLPDDTRSIEVAGAPPSVSWTYWTGSGPLREAHIVNLTWDPAAETFVVDAVSW